MRNRQPALRVASKRLAPQKGRSEGSGGKQQTRSAAQLLQQSFLLVERSLRGFVGQPFVNGLPDLHASRTANQPD
jgi:hypothetical protein